ncbi:helix-turn-helix domain-containing protein [Sphingobium phenoxybenzoativorans]|uniref:helix-turn-helix domain-containing protein n=1 Tax=Sphingobium phenoxybenzoativorans TaxID=1592790 RepID=UPI0008726E62|nr:hypothetical protein [Sphingobium phenoxybenzoativorans]
MTTSLTPLQQAISEPEISKFWLGYMQEEFRAEVRDKLLEVFSTAKFSDGFTKADLARKSGKKPEQITRWLSSTGNFEIDTISDLLLAMGHVPRLQVVPVAELEPRGIPNDVHEISHFVKANGVLVTKETRTIVQMSKGAASGGRQTLSLETV